MHRIQLKEKIKGACLVDTINNAFTHYAARPYIGVKRMLAPGPASSSSSCPSPMGDRYHYHFFTCHEISELVRSFSRGLRYLMEQEYGVRHQLEAGYAGEDDAQHLDKQRKQSDRTKAKDRRFKKNGAKEKLAKGKKKDKEKGVESDAIARRDHGEQQAVGLCSLNRVEWVVADFASLFLGYISVPIHVPFEPAQKVAHTLRLASRLCPWLIVNHAGVHNQQFQDLGPGSRWLARSLRRRRSRSGTGQQAA